MEMWVDCPNGVIVREERKEESKTGNARLSHSPSHYEDEVWLSHGIDRGYRWSRG